jgi:GntR family transcriptional regulator/MocR family aminotransferase
MKMPGRLNLNRMDSRSMQTQLTAQLKQMIQAGDLHAGERLPSTRELAKDLFVSRNTVVAAYEMLVGEGYLQTELRSGFRVNQATQAFQSLPVGASETRARAVVPESPRMPVPFRPTQPDVSLFPLPIWNRHRNRILKRGMSLLQYQSRFPVGLDELRCHVADYLRDSRGVRCQWHEVAITNGSQHALFLLAHLLLQPGQRVYMEDPGYPGARNAWDNAGATILPAPVDDEGIKLPAEDPLNAKLIYVTPSHQFPLGTCMSLARRLSLLQAARKANAWIVEDDYDAEFRYTSAPQPSLQSLDDQRRVIYIGSFSKTLFPALRIGYVVLPPTLVESFAALKSIADDYSPLIDQATLAAFLESGSFYAHLRRCRKHYAERQALFLHLVSRHRLPLTFPISGRGMNLAGMLPEEMEDQQVSLRLKAVGLDVPPLSRYAVKPVSPGLLFGLAAFGKRDIERGVDRMAEIFRIQPSKLSKRLPVAVHVSAN